MKGERGPPPRSSEVLLWEPGKGWALCRALVPRVNRPLSHLRPAESDAEEEGYLVERRCGGHVWLWADHWPEGNRWFRLPDEPRLTTGSLSQSCSRPAVPLASSAS